MPSAFKYFKSELFIVMNYIYVLRDPRDGKIRYVGRTIRPKTRLYVHISNSKNGKTPRDFWIKELVNADMRPVLSVVDAIDHYGEAVKREIELIKKYGDQLLNIVSASSDKIKRMVILSERSVLTLEKIGNGSINDGIESIVNFWEAKK